MIDFFLFNKILIFLINITTIYLVFLVLYNKNNIKNIKKIFILMATSMLIWVDFAYLARIAGGNQIADSLLFIKIAWFATPLLFSFLLLLTIYLIGEEQKYKFLNKIALFLGNESQGLSNKLLKKLDLKVSIKMKNDFDSLNVSVAAGILIHALK